ncbi:MAG: preprotein translocase subunit SecY, partial [Nitrococcus sp.]|nr:preprotein translocase subunit SecY [Nitrococcus sp.]
MARATANLNSLAGFGRLTEVRQRLVFVLIALIVYRFGTHLTIPGIDQAALAAMFERQQGTILDMFNMFSGGALQRLSVFALGVMPYISA